MNFGEALEAMKIGHMARRMARGELHTFVATRIGFFRVYTGMRLQEWEMLTEDILAEDWNILLD